MIRSYLGCYNYLPTRRQSIPDSNWK